MPVNNPGMVNRPASSVIDTVPALGPSTASARAPPNGRPATLYTSPDSTYSLAVSATGVAVGAEGIGDRPSEHAAPTRVPAATKTALMIRHRAIQRSSFLRRLALDDTPKPAGCMMPVSVCAGIAANISGFLRFSMISSDDAGARICGKTDEPAVRGVHARSRRTPIVPGT